VNEKTRTHLDLFSGIGGFALAARWAGFETVAFCEQDRFCQRVLERHWPGVPCVDDVHDLDGGDHKGVTLLTGGFPCQPFSQAGKRRGEEDDRAIWPQMARVISEARPTWVLGENVAGLVSVGLDAMLSDLEGMGYATQTFIIPACALNAPHRRDRVWIVAYSDGRGRNAQPRICSKPQEGFSPHDAVRPDATLGKEKTWMAEPDVERVVYGVSRKLDKTRVAQLGNAIVPQVAFEIIREMT